MLQWAGCMLYRKNSVAFFWGGGAILCGNNTDLNLYCVQEDAEDLNMALTQVIPISTEMMNMFGE